MEFVVSSTIYLQYSNKGPVAVIIFNKRAQDTAGLSVDLGLFFELAELMVGMS